MGIGSFVGAMLVAAQSKKKPSKLVLYGLPVLSGLSLIALGLTHTYALTCVAIAFAGYFIIRYTATANSTLQTNSDPEHLGRVMVLAPSFLRSAQYSSTARAMAMPS